MNTAEQLAVECRGVKKTYGSGSNEVHALRSIDLTVREGELMMLVGPSGCGKTTLISIIAGVLDATAGECTVSGESMQQMSGSTWRRLSEELAGRAPGSGAQSGTRHAHL